MVPNQYPALYKGWLEKNMAPVSNGLSLIVLAFMLHLADRATESRQAKRGHLLTSI